jgi:hypothetical protein
MSIRSAQTVVVEFTTCNPTTGAAVNADSLPAGTLTVNGVDNAAAVTITNVDAGRYKASVTLPTLAVGDVVELSVAATVATVAGKGIVWRDSKDLLLDAAGKTTDAVQTGDSFARLGAAGAGLTALGDARLANLDATVSSRSSHSAADVWASGTRTLTAFGFTVTLPANPPAGFLVAASYGTAPAWYAAPDNTTLAHLATALELNAGNYRFTVAALANAPAGGGGSGDWTVGELAQIRQALGVTGTVAVTSGAGVLDLAYAKLLTWSSAPTVAVAPVNPVTGDITLVRGDDYLAADGRQLSWAAPTSGWPSLAGAAVNLLLGDLAPVAALAVGPPVQFELTRAQTAALAPGPGVPCVVRATLADGSVVTLARGHARVLP